MMKLNAWIVAAGCLVLIGCGSSNKTADSSQTKNTAVASDTAGSPTAPTTKAPQKSHLKALKITDVKIGDGSNLGIKMKSNPSAAVGDILSIEYTGKLADGTVFDTNVPGKGKSDLPFVLVIGPTPVIAGWNRGIVGMKIGGERKLEIPPSLGYGAEGMPPAIPPDADLFFDIKLLDIVKKGDEGTFDSLDVTKGTGPAVKSGGTITIQYTGTFSNGVVFDSNMGSNKAPIAVKIGAGMVISGLESGLIGMQKGGVRKLRIPPAIAYGTERVEGIPANSTLYYTVKALDVS